MSCREKQAGDEGESTKSELVLIRLAMRGAVKDGTEEQNIRHRRGCREQPALGNRTAQHAEPRSRRSFFHHGWPLSADDWDSQMMFFLGVGYRVLAHDDDLAAIDVPVPVIHGEDDKICPFTTTGARSVTLVKDGRLISCPGLPHGMPTPHADVINRDLLASIRG